MRHACDKYLAGDIMAELKIDASNQVLPSVKYRIDRICFLQFFFMLYWE
jgi:hypothetical protein